MTLYAVIFYVIGIVILIATALAITRRHIVHAVIYLAISFLGTALLFYLLGAPFLAVLEVIIFAGAIVVLFLFIIMMIGIEPSSKSKRAALWQWSPAIFLCGISLIVAAILIFSAPEGSKELRIAMVTPVEFGHFLFMNYWLPVELVSLLLFIALVGSLYLGKEDKGPKETR
jgi:NADH-quinone oxidoreductase subunit J